MIPPVVMKGGGLSHGLSTPGFGNPDQNNPGIPENRGGGGGGGGANRDSQKSGISRDFPKI